MPVTRRSRQSPAEHTNERHGASVINMNVTRQRYGAGQRTDSLALRRAPHQTSQVRVPTHPDQPACRLATTMAQDSFQIRA